MTRVQISTYQLSIQWSWLMITNLIMLRQHWLGQRPGAIRQLAIVHTNIVVVQLYHNVHRPHGVQHFTINIA